MEALKLLRGQVAESRMQTLTIVPTLDELEDGYPRRGAGRDRLGGTLGFEGGKEALHHGIIVTIGGTAHADGDTMISQQVLVVEAGIVAAAVRVMQQWVKRSRLRLT
jgi:hypothetical protein